MRKVSKERLRVVAPAAVDLPGQLSLPTDGIAAALREGLLAMSTVAGLAALREIIEVEIEGLCGPRGRHDAARAAYRHGQVPSSLPLGGRKVRVERPRVRGVDGGEVALEAWQTLATADHLSELAVSRMLAGVSCRRYVHDGLEPVGEATAARSYGASKSAVSRRFVALTGARLAGLLARPVPQGVCVVFVDAVQIKGRSIVAALGIDTDGVKHLLGIREGATENARLVTALIEDLVARGLSDEDGLLFVIDGAKALHTAITRCFATRALIQRCQVHKARNITDELPAAEHGFVVGKLTAAWRDPDPDRAEQTLRALARSLDKTHPGAASSLREGLTETLTITRLGVPPTDALWRTLRSTNPAEQMFSICRTEQRNVKRWQSGDQALRWVAAGLTQAGKGWRRLRGHRSMPLLLAGLKHHVTQIDRTEADRAAA